jgi:hypothetical protein
MNLHELRMRLQMKDAELDRARDSGAPGEVTVKLSHELMAIRKEIMEKIKSGGHRNGL